MKSRCIFYFSRYISHYEPYKNFNVAWSNRRRTSSNCSSALTTKPFDDVHHQDDSIIPRIKHKQILLYINLYFYKPLYKSKGDIGSVHIHNKSVKNICSRTRHAAMTSPWRHCLVNTVILGKKHLPLGKRCFYTSQLSDIFAA